MVVAALAENLPHRSREHEFTDGRVKFSVRKLKRHRRKAEKLFSLVEMKVEAFLILKVCDIILFTFRFFQTRLYYHDDSHNTYVVILRT